MHDVRERIRDSRPECGRLRPLDIDELVQRGRRRTVAARSVAAVGIAGLLLGGVVVLDAIRPPAIVEVEPAEEAPTADPEPEAGVDDLDSAIEALIDANRSAQPRATPGEGQLLVERTSAIWMSGTVSGDHYSYELEVTRYETRTDADGTTRIVRTALGTVEPTDSLAELRAAAGRYFEDPPEGTEERYEGGDPQEYAEDALAEAERDSRGSAEPIPGRTERPDQAHAFIRAADALRVGLQPEDRIRALEAIGHIDPSLVEYRGEVPDLLGREGIAIAGRDGDGWGAPQWHVLIFDPETGDLLGEYQEFLGDGDEAPPITSYTARETMLVDLD